MEEVKRGVEKKYHTSRSEWTYEANTGGGNTSSVTLLKVHGVTEGCLSGVAEAGRRGSRREVLCFSEGEHTRDRSNVTASLGKGSSCPFCVLVWLALFRFPVVSQRSRWMNGS